MVSESLEADLLAEFGPTCIVRKHVPGEDKVECTFRGLWAFLTAALHTGDSLTRQFSFDDGWARSQLQERYQSQVI